MKTSKFMMNVTRQDTFGSLAGSRGNSGKKKKKKKVGGKSGLGRTQQQQQPPSAAAAVPAAAAAAASSPSPSSSSSSSSAAEAPASAASTSAFAVKGLSRQDTATSIKKLKRPKLSKQQLKKQMDDFEAAKAASYPSLQPSICIHPPVLE